MVCTSKTSRQKLQNSWTGSEKAVAVLLQPPTSGYHLGTSLPSEELPWSPFQRDFKIWFRLQTLPSVKPADVILPTFHSVNAGSR